MHDQTNVEITDSMRMYRLGVEGGRPRPGRLGVQPEWFYKGTGTILKAHGQVLEIPAYGLDGGEEPEVAGVYMISPVGDPIRLGLTIANEFSDHIMERQNFLYLAPSKLRNCAIGPELMIGDAPFDHLEGTVKILRHSGTVWCKTIFSGERNMAHSLANLEHHHFKYGQHRQPGDSHVHFFGADAFSFGEGVVLEDGDLMEVSFPALGRALRNQLGRAKGAEILQSVRRL
jgi:hypothetical protein